MKILSILTLVFSLLLIPASAARQSQSDTSIKYPNELPGFQFFESAKWKSLEPLTSTMADVRRVMGEPKEAHDVSQYTRQPMETSVRVT